MPQEEIAGLVPALRKHLGVYGRYLGGQPAQKQIGVYCRGLLSDLARKSVEPIALAARACVRTLQVLLTRIQWDETGLRDAMQRRIVQEHLPSPEEPREDVVDVVGWIDETSVAKKEEMTPGVQRQYAAAPARSTTVW